MTRSIPAVIAIAAFLCLSLAARSPARAADTPPNIVLIFIDDMGYADVGCFGADNLRTPHIDQLAAQGMRFTSYYATPVCSMSRASLMTGCYNARVSIPGVLFPHDKIGLNPDEITIAEVLKPRGYATCAVGKWHLGWQEKFLPPHQGFDHYFGIPYSNDVGAGNTKRDFPPLPIVRDTDTIETEPDQTQLTRRYTEEVVKFITEHKDGPFFVYLPHTMVHKPLAASERFAGKSKRGLYGDAVEEIDWSVGQIMDTLDRLGLADHTLVMFTSDNGPAGPDTPMNGSAKPFRGRKASTYEGGVREPTIVRWPGHVRPGTTCDRVIGNIDVLPTFAAVAGAQAPTDRVIDGRDFSSLLADPNAPPVRNVHLYYRGFDLEAIRVGDFKLRIAAAGKGKGKSVELFNLVDDPGESHNLAKQMPDKVAELRAEMDKRGAEVEANKRPPGKVD
ncbi:MAG: sulfatase-like hydrolase/transferase [Phycisphaera sp.]|nr:sulfatase-like hydrolase/transferase [Phycisphaera sp.]